MYRYSIIILLLTAILSFSEKKEEYVKILGADDLTVYLDKQSVESKNDEISVWVMQIHIPPLNIEGVNEKIYKSKTKYLFNKKLNRYGILRIIYFNSKGEIIKSFDYSSRSDIPDEYKYSYPVFEKSFEEKIINTVYYYYPELKPKEEK